MEDLPEAMLAEIAKKITNISDLNSLSLVSKQLYAIEAKQRGAIRIGCGLHPALEALTTLCFRFTNLWKVEINYSGWEASYGNQLDNQGLLVLPVCCPSLTDLTLSFCSYIDDSGLLSLACCKKLMTLRLNSMTEITSNGLLSVAIGCKSLSSLHLIDCQKIGVVDWLEYLGCEGSLEELVLKNCRGISQYDLLKFGPGWMRLQKFEYEFYIKTYFWNIYGCHDSSYVADYPYKYDFSCESLKDLSLARMATRPEIGLRFLLGKCKSLEKLRLEYVNGLDDSDLITLSQCCRNLRSISLWLIPQFYGYNFRTAFTDDSLKALALNCPLLQAIELTFDGCEPSYPSEIGFTQEGLIMLIQSSPIRVLVLRGANFFKDKGMEALSSAPLLETLELACCRAITGAGMRSIARAPCLTNLTLRICERVTDAGVAALVHAQKLESLIIEGCQLVSEQAVQGVARSVQYSVESASPGELKRAR